MLVAQVGVAQPDALHCSVRVQAAWPLHVHDPAEHVLVVAVAQSVFVQQSLLGMQALLHDLSVDGHAQPVAEHVSPPPQAIEPLHVHVPPLHALVVEVAQSALLQQSPDRMHDAPQSL